MTDSTIAAIGRRLAQALHDAAYERNDEHRKAVALLNMELCAAVSEEMRNAKTKDQQAHDSPPP